MDDTNALFPKKEQIDFSLIFARLKVRVKNKG